MISATSSSRHPLHVESPAPLSLLLDIPNDILPNIVSRLPGPALLDLARTCKQLSIDNKQDLLKDWAKRELIEIKLLDPEPLWTRTLDLLASGGHMIAIGDWSTFLDAVELQHKGYAMLLQMAVFSFKVGRGKDGLGSKAQSMAPDFSEDSYQARDALVRGAGKDAWKARAAGAVIAGQWHHSALWNRGADWGCLSAQFVRLPLAIQLKFIPLMLGQRGINVDTLPVRRLDSCSTLIRNHAVRFYEAHLQSPFAVNLATASPNYLLALSQMFGLASRSHNGNHACDLLREILGSSLHHGMRIGPWREQPPETALFVLLALEFDKKREGIDAGVGKQLLDGRFITSREYLDYKNFCLPGVRDRIEYTSQWIALNRGKPAKDEPESFCTIS